MSDHLTLVGPLPPPIGGATGTFDDVVTLATELLGRRPEIVDTSPTAHLGPIPYPYAALIRVAALAVRRRPGPLVIFANKRFITRLDRLLGVLVGRSPTAVACFGGGLGEELLRLAPRRRRRVIRHLTRSRAVFVQTELTQRELADAGIDAELLGWVRPPVGEAERPTRLAWADGRLRLAYAGRITPTKGVEELCHLASRDPRLDVTVMGPIDDRSGTLRPLLAKSAVAYREPGDRDDVLELFRNSDFAVLLSSWPNEGIAGCLVEALSVGTPIIVSRHRSLPELAVDGANGYIVDHLPGGGWDHDRLLRRLDALDPDTHRAMREQALATVIAAAPHDRVRRLLAAVGVTVPPARTD